METNRYLIKRLPDDFALPALDGVFDAASLTGPLSALDEARIDAYPWGGDYQPDARVRVGWNASGLYVLAYAREETIRAQVTEIGGPVCDDSCLEFFVMPFPEKDDRYLNFECNAGGVMHLGLGAGRADRHVFRPLPEGISPRASRHDGSWWAVAYRAPAQLFADCFAGARLEAGHVMRGNFYKCDESIHPHFGVWQGFSWPQADFHRPEFFSEMTLA